MDLIGLYLFITGLFFGSFYLVVAERLSNNKSIIFPGSHCDNCNHKLRWYELIPVFSYIFLKGKCKKCFTKLSVLYPLTEIITGVLFVLSYYLNGISFETLTSIVLVSIVIIIMITDIKYMIILDEVLITGMVLFSLITYFGYGIEALCTCLLNSLILGIIMLLIKLLGDRAFKKESLGWGDVKLTFLAGYLLGIEMGFIYIFLGAFLALPYAIYVTIKKGEGLIPFGPFLVISILLIYWNLPLVEKIIHSLLGV